MKRIVLAFIILMVMILPSYGADTAMNALGDVSGSLTSSHYAVGYKSTTAYRFTMASILGLKIGTVTNTDLCVGDAGGLIQCTVVPTTYLASIGGTLTGVLVATTPAAGASGYASIRLPHGAAPTTNITNGDCWTTTAGLYCYINGSTVGPYATGVGAGDVTDVGDCSSGACLDGSSDGGTYVRLYDGTSAYTSITAGVRTLTFLPSNANAESLVITFGNNTNVVALSSSTGAVVNISGSADTATSATTAANLSGTPALPDGTSATKQTAHANDTKLATNSYADALVSDASYNESTWNGVQYISPSKNAVRDYFEARMPVGGDGSYRLVVTNNTAIAPTASVDELYPEADVWKVNQAGTEYSMCIGPTAAQINFGGTLTNGKACTWATGGTITCNTSLSGTGDFMADGSVAMTGAIVPNSVGGQTIGSTSAEFGSIYIADGKVLYGQNNQSATFTSSASKWTANNLGSAGTFDVGGISTFTGAINPATAGGTTNGTAALPWSSLYLGNAATNNAQFTGTFAAARIINFPDIGATGYVPLETATSTTAGQILQSTTTAGKHTLSTAAYPLTAGTARKMLVSDGTNFLSSTELWPIATTSGNHLIADGTNWVTTAPTGTGTPVSATSPVLTTASITPQAIDCAATCTPTAAQLSNAIVGNYGQSPTSSGTVTVTAPALVAGINFVMTQGTALTSTGVWRLDAGASSLYLDASTTAQRYATFTAQAVSVALSCYSFKVGGSTWALRCTTLAGTAVGS